MRRAERLGPRMIRVTLAGPELEGFAVDEPAASVRLLLPSPGASALVMPAWNGNEFLLPDGGRPAIRTFTPRHVDPDALALDIDVVDHGPGEASMWAAATAPGDEAAVSGPGRGYTVDPEAPAYVLAGDETAIPAIGQLLEALPPTTPVEVRIQVPGPDARLALPPHPEADVEWCDDAVAAVRALDLRPGVRVWAAGEAAAMQRLRRHLFEERGMPRTQASVRGYWKHGRGGDAEDA